MAAAHLGFPVASGAALPRSFPSVHIACRSRFRDPSFAASIPPIVLHLGLMPVVRLCLGDSALRFSKTICLEAATNRVFPRVCAWVLADRCSHVQSPLHLGVGAHRSRWGPGHRALFFSCSLILSTAHPIKKTGREGSKNPAAVNHPKQIRHAPTCRTPATPSQEIQSLSLRSEQIGCGHRIAEL